MMKTILGVVGAVVVLVVLFLGYQYWKLQKAAVQWDAAKEIASESIEKEGSKWAIEFTSILNRPIDKVWNALQQPERSREFIPAFKKSELVKAEGDKKIIEFQVQVLTLPLQTLVAELTFDKANHRVTVKTVQSQTQDLNAVYELEASPDGARTQLKYTATAVDKITVPLPLSVQKGAMRELFVNQVRAILKGIEADEAKAKAAA